jgi:hypothetical protein
MPGENRFRPDDDEGVSPLLPDSRQPDPEETIQNL